MLGVCIMMIHIVRNVESHLYEDSSHFKMYKELLDLKFWMNESGGEFMQPKGITCCSHVPFSLGDEEYL